MANLGDNTTPVKGENFSLPAGAQIDEDGGDFVVRDSAGEIILRRDETAGNWNFEGGELRNIGSVHTESLESRAALNVSLDENNPYRTRMWERSGPPILQPHKSVSNPVLTAEDVTDKTDVTFVADPFICFESGVYHMFFEIKSSAGDDIGHATSPDGLTWEYQSAVIEANTMAAPQVFKFNGEWLMVPDVERGGSRPFDIRRATTFPTDWEIVETPIADAGNDPTPFYFQGRWYLIAGFETDQGVRLWYADKGEDLFGRSWTEHPASPIHDSTDKVRGSGGRPIVRSDSVDMFYQFDNTRSIAIRRISSISPTDFVEDEVAQTPHRPGNTGRLLDRTQRSGAWNETGMHHVDIMLGRPDGAPIAVVDGRDSNNDWSIGIYTLSDERPNEFKAHAGANTSVDSTEFFATAYDFNDRVYNPGNQASNNGFIPNSSGVYQLTAKLHWNLSDTEDATAPFRIAVQFQDFEDQGTLAEDFWQVHSFDDMTTTLTTMRYIRKSAFIKPRVWQNSGDTQVIESDENRSYFEARRVR